MGAFKCLRSLVFRINDLKQISFLYSSAARVVGLAGTLGGWVSNQAARPLPIIACLRMERVASMISRADAVVGDCDRNSFCHGRISV